MDPVKVARTFGLDHVLAVQDGLIRRDQALAAGVTVKTVERRVTGGTWQRILPGVYAVGVAGENPRLRVRAGWLWAGEDAVITGPAAAFWHGYGPVPGVIDILIPPARRLSTQRAWCVHRGRLDDREWVWRDDVKVTNVARTTLDLARVGLSDNVEETFRQRALTPAKLQVSLERGRGRRGQTEARRLVAAVAAGPWSMLERNAHELLRRAGIKGWAANVMVRVDDRYLILDLAFEDCRLDVELDGRRFHAADEDFERDRERDAALVAAGWTVLRFTWNHVMHRPELVIATVRATLTRLRANT